MSALGQAFMDDVGLRQVIRPEGYGKPAVLAFHSGECSGCGSRLSDETRLWVLIRRANG